MTVNNAEDNSTAHAPVRHSSFPGPRAKALASLALKFWKDAQPTPVTPPADWAISPIAPGLANRKVDLVVAPDPRAMAGAASAKVQGIVVDLGALRHADASEYQQAFAEVIEWVCGDVAPLVWLRLRTPTQGRFDDALEDAAFFLAHAAEQLQQQQRIIGIELSGLRNSEDAQRWECALAELERAVSVPPGTIQLTLRLDNHSAVTNMDAVVYPLRHRVTATRMSLAPILSDMIMRQGCGHNAWQPARQDALTLNYPLADALAKHFTVSAHRRGVLALSGMLSTLPVHDDEATQTAIMQRTAELARQRLRSGYDGVAFAHSALVDAVDTVFADMMPTDNQLERPLDWSIQPADMESVGQGPVSEAGLRNNVGVAIQGIEAVLQGRARFALYNQIEDYNSTALCWQQLWQWVQTPEAALDDGTPVEPDLVRSVIAEELEIIRLERETRPLADDQVTHSAELLLKICVAPDLPVFPAPKAAA